MRSLKRKRRIAPRSRRALEIGMTDGSKEDPMVPGITDTECRLNQLRYRELHAEAARQRLVAMACAKNDRDRVTATVQSRLAILMERSRHFMPHLRAAHAGDQAMAP